MGIHLKEGGSVANGGPAAVGAVLHVWISINFGRGHRSSMMPRSGWVARPLHHVRRFDGPAKAFKIVALPHFAWRQTIAWNGLGIDVWDRFWVGVAASIMPRTARSAIAIPIVKSLTYRSNRGVGSTQGAGEPRF